jgi:hypothetical protein
VICNGLTLRESGHGRIGCPGCGKENYGRHRRNLPGISPKFHCAKIVMEITEKDWNR